MATLHVVTGDQYRAIDRRMREIKRQLDQDGGSPLNPDWVAGELQRLIHGKFGDANAQLAEWVQLYAEHGIQLDPSVVRIPDKRPGFDRLIVVAQGVGPQWAYDECAKLFLCWKWTDRNLDEVVQSDRTSKDASYAVWFRDRGEADEELKNLSANQLSGQGTQGITLEERLVYELKHFKENGHLDVTNVTLCSGSRYSDGSVPGVSWDDGRLGVDWCGPDGAHGGLRSREAVS